MTGPGSLALQGMLINNSLSGVALALNAMIDHLYNHKEQAIAAMDVSQDGRDSMNFASAFYGILVISKEDWKTNVLWQHGLAFGIFWPISI